MILYQLLRELLRMGNKSTETPDTPATGGQSSSVDNKLTSSTA